MEDREVTLAQMLDFRERKAVEQEKLRHAYKDGVVISLGMNIPGPVKRTPSVFRLFTDGRMRLEEMLAKSGGTIRETVIMDEPAGCAAIYVVTGTDARVLKRKAVSLEETHPCGRLFDIDTLDSKGMPITREQVGSGKRTCLLCNRDAKVCGRSRTHSVEELTDQVWRMIEIWEQSR